MRSILLRSLMFLACLWIGCGLAWAAPEAASSRLPRDTTFVIDTSGSMDGLPLELARQALLLGLERLRPSDWFNVIELGSEAKALFSGSVPAQASSVQQALSYARNLKADGGTNSWPAFLGGCKDGGASSGLTRQVVLISDGLVETAAPWKLKEDLGDCRLFVVGVGAAAATGLLSEGAELGRGSFTYIANSSEVVPRMGVLFAQLESPMPDRVVVQQDEETHSSCTSYYVGPDSGDQAVWTLDGVVITDMEDVGTSDFDSFEEMQEMRPCARVLDAGKARSHRARAEALVKTGKLKEAEAEYIQALVQNLTDEDAWRGLQALGREAGFALDRRAIGSPCADEAAGPDQEAVERFIRGVVIVR